MNTENLIPISYVKKFTPLVVGDVVLSQGRQYTIDNPDTGFNSSINNHGVFLISFAPRTNAGKQPVRSDVKVFINDEDVSYPANSTMITWDYLEHNKTWKIDHAALLAKFKQGANEMNAYTEEFTQNAVSYFYSYMNNQMVIFIKTADGFQALWQDGEVIEATKGETSHECVIELSRPIGERKEDHTIDGVTTYALTYKLDLFTVLATHFSRVTDLHYQTIPGEFANVLVVKSRGHDNTPTDWEWVVSDMTTNSELIHNIKGEFWSLNGDFANRSDEVATVDGKRVEPLKAEDKPVFTQEMADAGEIPQIGVKCEIKLRNNKQSSWEVGSIEVRKGDWVCIDRCRSLGVCDLADLYFRPIDNRTDEEKAIEDIQRYNTFTTVDFVDAIKADKIHGVKWEG